MSNRTRLAGFIWICIVLLGSPVARAQERAPEIAILHTATEPQAQADSLPLSIFFTLRDQNGNPIPKGSVSLDAQATVILSDAAGQPLPPAPATISDPKTPIKIALVIDKSGSMNQKVGNATDRPLTRIDAVRAAAIQSLQSAPDQAEFAVFSFAEKPELQSGGFLRKKEQANLIVDAINKFQTNPSNTGNTCLSDAANYAIDYLNTNVQNPIERKAIIVFTDGKDKEADNQKNNGNNCSNMDLAAIVRKAQLSTSATIPIYTIGSCDQSCADLEDLARNTRAASAIGSLNDINKLFQQIMELLNSQWVAQTNVFASKGLNTATLRVKIRDNDGFLSAATNFVSDRDYAAPPSFEITPTYDESKDSYTVTMKISHPESVSKVVVEIWDKEDGGTLVKTVQTVENLKPDGNLTFSVTTDGLTAGREFWFRVMADRKVGGQLKNAQGGDALYTHKFTYEPKLDYSIEAVEPNWDRKLVDIRLNIRGAGSRTLSFKGAITDKDTAQTVAEITPAVPQGGQLQIPLPATWQTSPERAYVVALELQDGDRVIKRSFDRVITPPRPPGIFERIPAPIMLGGLLVVLAGIGGAFAYTRWSRSRPREIPRPFNAQTVIRPAMPGNLVVQPQPPATGETEIGEPAVTVMHEPKPSEKVRKRVWVKVVQTVDTAQQLIEQEMPLPCVIGREKADFTITGDAKLSRAHVQIAIENGVFTLTDLNSANGTFVGSTRLDKGGSAPLAGRTRVRLGPNTTIELEPRG